MLRGSKSLKISANSRQFVGMHFEHSAQVLGILLSGDDDEGSEWYKLVLQRIRGLLVVIVGDVDVAVISSLVFKNT